MFDLDAAVRSWRMGFARERTFSTSDLDELEDHLRAAYEVELDLCPTLTHDRAFTQACESLGAAGALSGEFAKVEGKAWRRLLTAGWLLFAVSFFLPVARHGITLPDLAIKDGGLPGIQAFLIAITGGGGFVGALSALTNVIMALTFHRISDAGRGRIRALTALVLASVVLNVWWIVSTDPVSDLFAGYYAWLASFGVVGTGLFLRARALPEPATAGDLIAAP